MSSLLPLEQNDKYRRPQRIICAGAPHRERIRFAMHPEFFTESANTDRHDLPHPYSATTQWNQFHCERQFNNVQQCEFRRALCMREKRQAKSSPAKPAGQGAFASNGRTIPLGEMPINRETATNRNSSRSNKIERID
ncbi:hypothetical protein [Burkholderia sp. Bp9143]|uniref:hypothetical protein n=1 Tax=Burkholderia sp. Bp9143 TaxID=2184574 RepID=UPI0021AB8390|nr:hypothetical protein [Burkholderia sp. Bp9143]